MKRAIALVLAIFLLTGCSTEGELNHALKLREQLLNSDGCTFEAVITADYGQKVHTFSMQCSFDDRGDLSFTVTKPETINGITGTISGEGGMLTFDDQVLAFELLADDQVTPVSGPWLLIRTLRSGYIRACGEDGEYKKLQIDDSYEEEALALDIWLDEDGVPARADIMYDGRRIVSLEVYQFAIL